MSNTDGLKSIQEIIEPQEIIKQKTEFWVRDYQRGYRWTATEVNQLLEDINEFEGNEFYCLQPVVVKKVKDNGDEKIELIDGQQRMTTIFLILKYLDVKHENPFTISYETRAESGAFLKEINKKTKEASSINIDFFHFFQAYQTIQNWISNNKPVDFKDKLLKHCKVIWYEVPEETNKEESIKIFTRINSGKIPLTNAELIKALFLINVSYKKGNGDELLQLKQNEIAQQWDQIEYALQDDRFWCFISNDTPPATRIEFIFDLIKNKDKKEQDKLFTFLKYNESFKGKTDKAKWVESEWKEVCDKFQTLQEWYEDRELYHLVGYLVATNQIQIQNLINKKGSKSQLKKELKDLIKDEFKDCVIEELKYPDKKIQDILLLLNIETLLKNENEEVRFPFLRFKSDNWDLEHIHAQQSQPLNSEKLWKNWLEDTIAALNNIPEAKEILKDIKIAVEQPLTQDSFNKIYEEVFQFFNKIDEIDPMVCDLSNLTLLDAGTNRSYRNAIFPSKRAKIIERDKAGIFIPICTKNVFLKYYNSNPEKMYLWTSADREAYLKDIETTLKDYLETTTKDK